MINLGVILIFLNSVLILEALVDAFVYLSWTKPLVKSYGKLHHLFQLLLFSIIFVFGGWIVYIHIDCLSLLLINVLWILLVYIMMRISIFNKLYNHFSGQKGFGKTDLWDEFCTYILNKIQKVKYYKTIIVIFDICRFLLYVGGIILLYFSNYFRII